jgi:hypothetical protein
MNKSPSVLNGTALFPQDLIVHFSYHKCLTQYYGIIMRTLAREFDFYTEHFQGRVEDFKDAVLNTAGKRILSVNNRGTVFFPGLPDYRGSHFVRDPRDLIVSGYHYHLHTEEKWCNDPGFNWRQLAENPWFSHHVVRGKDAMPAGISYRNFLNSLEKEPGMILEMIWRAPHLRHMEDWDYENARILELRYESIVGNELEAFDRLFRHYGFEEVVRERALEIVDRFSLAKRLKKGHGHVRSGKHGQWMQELTPLCKRLFHERFGSLLFKLKYETDEQWYARCLL